MLTDLASTIRREVNQLVELQIQTFRQESSLTSSDLLDYGLRAGKSRTLYQELDRIGRRRVKLSSSRAS